LNESHRQQGCRPGSSQERRTAEPNPTTIRRELHPSASAPASRGRNETQSCRRKNREHRLTGTSSVPQRWNARFLRLERAGSG
jgi:hypothetical protein